MQVSKNKKILQVIIALMAWAALLMQFYLIILNSVATLTETIIRYFSFFTILTNILVAISFTVMLVADSDKWKHLFLKTSNLTAVTVYILVVGIVYNLVLRWLWQPQGLQKLTDELLHTIIRLAVLIYWFLFVATTSVQWRHVFRWMWYPFIYCLYTLVRGAVVNFYPYPFLDVDQLGYSRVLLNCVFVTIAFFAISLLLVGAGKLLRK